MKPGVIIGLGFAFVCFFVAVGVIIASGHPGSGVAMLLGGAFVGSMAAFVVQDGV